LPSAREQPHATHEPATYNSKALRFGSVDVMADVLSNRYRLGELPCGVEIRALRGGALWGYPPVVRRWMLRCACCVAGVLLACGARTDLDGLRRGEDGGGASGGGGGATVEPPPPCDLAPAGPATEVLGFPDRHATAPSVRTIDPAGRLAVQTFASGGDGSAHPDIQLLFVEMGAAWPGSVSIYYGPVLFGIESHGWGNLSLAPPGRAEVALGWHGDPGGSGRPMFRRFDLTSSTLLDPVDLARDGEAVLDLVPSERGYAAAWRSFTQDGQYAPSVATLDASGTALTLEQLAAYRPYPGKAPALAATSVAYLAATAFQDCMLAEPLCEAHSVVITRFGAPDEGARIVTSIPVAAGVAASRPSFAQWAGRTYLAWAEGMLDTPGPRTLRVAELSASGELVHGPVVVEQGLEVLSRVTLVAAELGLALVWVGPGDDRLPPEMLGYHRVFVTHFDHEIVPRSSRLAIEIPLFNDYGPVSGATSIEPRSLVLVFGARRMARPGFDGLYAARLDCR
jgi:hypothetical protein